jgi:hypothetical protein
MDEFPIWRVWKEKGVSLHELRWEWTYEDIMQANAILDQDAAYQAAIEGLREDE